MKKVCTRVGTSARRAAGTRIDKAPPLSGGNSTSHGIHLSSPHLHSDSRRRPEAPRIRLTADASVLQDLGAALSQVTAADHPRTFKLLESGVHKLTRKLIEEACEVTVETVQRNPAGVVRESADLLYHLVVLWFHIGIEPTEIWEEMQARASALGLAEKRPKTGVFNTLPEKFNR
jgi:phosphoribosyl-ATP pyrophosphohydrolase